MAVVAVKRSPMPRRRQGLRSGGPLHRGGRLAPVSEKRQAVRDDAEPIVQAVFERDQDCVMVGQGLVDRRSGHRWGCLGRLTPHHLRKAGQGGAWATTNLVTLCARHNGWVEQEPDIAHSLGLVIRTGEGYPEAWARMRAAGLGVGAEHDPATGRAL